MSRFKTGDVIIGPMLGRRWVFIAELNGYSYALHENDGPGADATSFIGTLDDGWKLAPELFFEEGKRYQSSGSPYVWQVDRVGEIGDDRWAVMFDVDNPTDIVVRLAEDLRFYKEVQ